MPYSPRDELFLCLSDAATMLVDARINAETMRQEAGFDWYPLCHLLKQIQDIHVKVETLLRADIFNDVALSYGEGFAYGDAN